MTNLSPLDQALHDADDKEIADALRYLGRAERIAAALNAQAGVVEALRLAYSHLDTAKLRVSHAKDAATIEAALAAVRGETP